MGAKQSSAVDKALKLVSKGMTPYAAAKKTGIALSTIYRAVKRRSGKDSRRNAEQMKKPVCLSGRL